VNPAFSSLQALRSRCESPHRASSRDLVHPVEWRGDRRGIHTGSQGGRGLRDGGRIDELGTTAGRGDAAAGPGGSGGSRAALPGSARESLGHGCGEEPGRQGPGGGLPGWDLPRRPRRHALRGGHGGGAPAGSDGAGSRHLCQQGRPGRGPPPGRGLPGGTGSPGRAGHQPGGGFRPPGPEGLGAGADPLLRSAAHHRRQQPASWTLPEHRQQLQPGDRLVHRPVASGRDRLHRAGPAGPERGRHRRLDGRS